MERFLDEYPKKSPESEVERTIDCVWCVDSETGDRVLMNRKTNKPIGVWRNNEIKTKE